MIKVCRDEQRCLVTLDLDFSNTLVFKPSDYHGIAILRVPDRVSLPVLEDLARLLIAALQRESIDGKLWVVQPGRIRIAESDRDVGP